MMAEMLERLILAEDLLREWLAEQRRHSHCLHCNRWTVDLRNPPGTKLPLPHAPDCLVVRTLAALGRGDE